MEMTLGFSSRVGTNLKTIIRDEQNGNEFQKRKSCQKKIIMVAPTGIAGLDMDFSRTSDAGRHRTTIKAHGTNAARPAIAEAIR